MIKQHLFPDLKRRPYDLLGYAALLLFLDSFIPSTRDALDINLHDTYFVIANLSLYRLFSGFLLFLWTINMLAQHIVYSLTLSWVYVICMLITIALFLMLLTLNKFYGVPRRYYSFDEFEKRRSVYNIYIIYACAFVVLVAGQLLLIINVIIGLVKGKNRAAKVS